MNAEYHCAPVLLLGFNRPDLTEGLLSCVRKACPQKVYFAVDGPRTGHPNDQEAVARVQALAKTIDWPCEIKTRFQESNLGCAYAIPDAISWMLSQEPYGIILEDDVRPVEGFFRFESELLERYKNDCRIGLVSGFSHYEFQTDPNASYHFTNRAEIWGWGTWSRVWKDYSVDIRPIRQQIEETIYKFTPVKRVRESMQSALDTVSRDHPTTWDFQFSFLIATKGYLAAEPRRRLTSNVGMGDPRAVHCTAHSYDSTLYKNRWDGEIPLIHPTNVAIDTKAIRKTERRMTGKASGGIDYLCDKMPSLRKYLQQIGRFVERIAPVLFRIAW